MPTTTRDLRTSRWSHFCCDYYDYVPQDSVTLLIAQRKFEGRSIDPATLILVCLVLAVKAMLT